ncbi:MAG TPA: CoA transferase, partial [Alphaproteobacteria bacterium]|nr:CoA transferase [Alphaproteobacteria bacterium]
MPLTGVFPTRDGAVVLVGAFKTHPLRDIGAAVDLPELETDPRFASFDLQVKNKAQLHEMLRARFKTNDTAYWLGRLDEQDLLCMSVRPLSEALADPQTAINGMVLEAPGVVETVRVIGSPVHLSDAAVTIRIPPAKLGQHTQEVLAEFGLKVADPV